MEESSSNLGVVTASKSRDAVETGQVAGQIALTVVFALLGAAYNPVWDKYQKIHVTTTVVPAESRGQYAVRVSFDRYIWNNQGLLWRTELVSEPKIYQEFFEKLGHGRALTASAS